MVKNIKTLKRSLMILGLIYSTVFSLWFLYRMFFRFSEAIDELVVKPILWITPVIIFNYLKKLPSVNISFPKNFQKAFVVAMLIGITLPLIQIFPRLINQGVNPSWEWSFLIFLIPIGTAMSEEYLFRGLFMHHLLSYFPHRISNLIVSIFFAFIHLPLMIFIYNNDIAVVLSRFYLLIISSFFFGYLYIKNKTIVPSVIAHYINNLIFVII